LLEKDTDEMFSVLYRILDVVIATLVLVITVLMGMLMNIYQSQRLIEFGLLQAIGYTRAGLVRRVLRESLWVIAVGWLVGVLVSFSFLILAKTTFMDRRGFELSVLDPMAYLYTVPIPLAIIAVATLTVVFRFRKFDPVGVVERRLV
ncbi:MAG: FtsX-like permease family protein, partial [Fimbriimonas ginsengisoli]|nr:FtsX-like permease family protein [Fimbriimonas ginsengisoli]